MIEFNNNISTGFLNKYIYKLDKSDIVGGIDFNAMVSRIDDIFSDSSIISPSEYFYTFPDEGSYVFTYQSSGYIRNNLISPFKDNYRDLSYMDHPYKDKNPNVNPLNIMSAFPGDVYIGKYARGYFNKNVYLRSNNHRSRIVLRDDGDANIYGYRWAISTPDNSASIKTSYLEDGEFANEISISRFNSQKIESKVLVNDNILMSAYGKRTSFNINSNGDFSLLSNNESGVGISGLNFSKESKSLNIFNGNSSLIIDSNSDSTTISTSKIEINSSNAYINSKIVVSDDAKFNKKVSADSVAAQSLSVKSISLNGDFYQSGGAFINKAYTSVIRVNLGGMSFFIPVMSSM